MLLVCGVVAVRLADEVVMIDRVGFVLSTVSVLKERRTVVWGERIVEGD